MTPLHAAAGAVVVAFMAGTWYGYDYRDAQAGREKAQQSREVVTQMERSMERRAASDLALAGVQSAVAAALRSKPYAPPAPIPCPASGNARDAVLPGLGDRLRAVDAAAGGGSATSMALVPGAGASDTSR